MVYDRIELLDCLSTSCRRSPSVSRFTYLVESFLIEQQSNPNPTSVHCPRYHRRRRCYPVAVMITRFLTEVRVAFNPFSPRSKPARLFLSLIPADARASGMNVQSKLLPRTSKENATLDVKFSMCPSYTISAAAMLRALLSCSR